MVGAVGRRAGILNSGIGEINEKTIILPVSGFGAWSYA
jgi:hypothetical protein